MDEKNCTKCRISKPFSEFATEKRNKSGIGAICKKCSHILNQVRARERYKNDENFRNKLKKAEKERRKKMGHEKYNNYMKDWRKTNPEKCKKTAAKKYFKNRDEYRYRARCRKAALRERTPKWLTEYDLFVIKCIYEKAKELETVFGISFHVDHIIPLRGEKVSGLHCPSNLQILPAAENIAKSNKFSIGEQ